MQEWTLSGPGGRPIAGTTHPASGGVSRGHMVLAHGFKGYKDYGFFPWLAEHVAQSGVVVHRFNFSCSGMDHGDGPFDEVAFSQDTWNRQVDDIVHVLTMLADGTLADGGGVLLVGHSRGGVSSLLAAGRHAGSGALSNLRGVVTLAAPSACLSMDQSQQDRLLADGVLSSPSSRTGQDLKVGRAFLQDQLDDPSGHDLLMQVQAISVPVTVVHGTDDDAVDVSAADEISRAAGGCPVHLIQGSNHVFNTPNPSAIDHDPSEALRQVGARLIDAASRLGGH